MFERPAEARWRFITSRRCACGERLYHLKRILKRLADYEPETIAHVLYCAPCDGDLSAYDPEALR